jgi:3-isopropylmalate/(R)-2-methylmalate dehydratase small subunit
MEKFAVLDSVAVPIARANVDTDQIVPSRYLQKPRADNFGNYLFRDLRVAADGMLVPDFVLNDAAYAGAHIVVAERNFGCGSSREHAVWALYDYGIRAVIAPSFGDIFATNALKNGLLPIVLRDAAVQVMIRELLASPGTRMRVDLVEQWVIGPDGARHSFEVEPFAKHCLVEGLDELGFTLGQMPQIEAFERRYRG